MRALVDDRLHYRETRAPTCAEQNLWAIRRSWLIQVDQLVSYPLAFIHLKPRSKNSAFHTIRGSTNSCLKIMAYQHDMNSTHKISCATFHSKYCSTLLIYCVSFKIWCNF